MSIHSFFSRTNDQQAKKENTEVATGSAHTEQSEHAIEEMKKKRHETEKQSLLLKQQVLAYTTKE